MARLSEPIGAIVRTNAAAYGSFAAALAAAGAGTLYAPPGTYPLTAPVTPAAGAALDLHPGAIFAQATKYQPVFDLLNVPGVTIEGGQCQYSGDRTYTGGGTAFRGSDPYVYGAAVWSNSPATIVRGLQASGFTSAVALVNWNGTTLAGFVAGNTVEDVTVSAVDFAVLMTGQDRPLIRAVRGSYAQAAGSPNPAHLLYVSAPNACRNVLIDDLAADSGVGGRAYSLKNITSGAIGKLAARNCPGLADVANLQNVSIGRLVADGDVSTDQNGVVYFLDALSSFVQIDVLQIAMTGEFRVLRFDGTDNRIGAVRMQTVHTTINDSIDIAIQGTRNRIGVITATNTPATGGAVVASINSGDGNAIGALDLTNIKKGVQVQAAATNSSVALDPTKVTIASGVGNASRHVQVLSASTAIQRGPQRLALTMATASGTGTLTPVNVFEAPRYSHVQINATGAAAFTVPAPLEPATGLELLIEISNGTAGALGAVTWDPSYDLRSAWTAPAAGARTFSRFVYDGTQWREVARA